MFALMKHRAGLRRVTNKLYDALARIRSKFSAYSTAHVKTDFRGQSLAGVEEHSKSKWSLYLFAPRSSSKI